MYRLLFANDFWHVLGSRPYVFDMFIDTRNQRAPDSIQFNLVDMSDVQVDEFTSQASSLGLKVQVFGRSDDNARAFWNWKFLSSNPDQPMTRRMLGRACDVRLPTRLTLAECDVVAETILNALNARLSN